MRAVRDALATFSVADLLDVDGRPCGELASRRYDEVATAVVACPYAGARRGLPMNRSALVQIAAVWPEVVAQARALAGPAPTVHAAFRVAVTGLAAPPAWRASHPEEPIPRLLSAFFKTSLGFSQVLGALLLADDGVADAPLADLGDAAAFLGYLEAQRWLVGQVQVCAGTDAMIAQLFEALCGSGTTDGVLDPALGDPERYAPAAVADIAAQLAYLCATRGFLRAGAPPADTPGERWLARLDHPWLRAAVTVPNRPAWHARRLFPEGKAPAAVEALVAAPDRAALERVWAST